MKSEEFDLEKITFKLTMDNGEKFNTTVTGVVSCSPHSGHHMKMTATYRTTGGGNNLFNNNRIETDCRIEVSTHLIRKKEIARKEPYRYIVESYKVKDSWLFFDTSYSKFRVKYLDKLEKL